MGRPKRFMFKGEGQRKALKVALSPVFVVALMLSAAVLATAPVSAQDDLAKQSQNPVAKLISVPFENNTYFEVGPDEEWANVFLMKPVYPLGLGNLNLINRFIIPVIYLKGQDVLVSGKGKTDFGEISAVSLDDEFGLGNIQYQAFFSPAKPGKLIWGLGPAFEFPTNTDDALGTDKWSAGISALVLAMPGKWVVGALAQNIWDYAGDDDEPDVNKFTFQYFINYNLEKGWYLTSTPVIIANWEADKGGDIWTVPFGGGVGRLMRFGKLPVDFKLAAYWNAHKPDNGPDWSLQFTVKFLFPK